MEELSKNNFLSKNFVNLENIYKVSCIFEGIVREIFSQFDSLRAEYFLGLDIFGGKIQFKYQKKDVCRLISTDIKIKFNLFYYLELYQEIQMR